MTTINIDSWYLIIEIPTVPIQSENPASKRQTRRPIKTFFWKKLIHFLFFFKPGGEGCDAELQINIQNSDAQIRT